MPDGALWMMLSTAAATALLHTLIPDHWLPFVLIGRARGWSGAKVGLVSGLSAGIHATLSALLGLVGLGLSRGAAEALGHRLEEVGAASLVVFGVAYAAWAARNEGHFHPGGRRFHAGEAPDGACPGDEGDDADHLHYHADRHLIEDGKDWSALGLAVIVGINPCLLVLPLMLGSAQRGPGAMSLVVLAYTVPTVLLMVGLAVGGVLVGSRLRLPVAARHMQMASGLLVAALGVAYWFFDFH